MASMAEAGYRQVCFLHSLACFWLCLLLISELGIVRIAVQSGICITARTDRGLKRTEEKMLVEGEMQRVCVF